MIKKVEIIGVPLDLGANLRGANMGPAAIRIAELHQRIKSLGYQLIDHGDLFVPVRESIPHFHYDEKYLSIIKNLSIEIADRTYKALENDRLPITIGGDHSLAIGSISGVSHFYKEKNQEDIGVIWFDAHADMNTHESSESGNIHGMPLAALLGLGSEQLTDVSYIGPKVKPENVVLVGIRDIDSEEQRICKSSGIRYYTMREIDERGMLAVATEAISKVSSNSSGIHVSFDLDGIDPLFAPGVSTPVNGGLNYREAHVAHELIAESKQLISMDFVELNPVNDMNHRSAELTVELILSLLGKTII